MVPGPDRTWKQRRRGVGTRQRPKHSRRECDVKKRRWGALGLFCLRPNRGWNGRYPRAGSGVKHPIGWCRWVWDTNNDNLRSSSGTSMLNAACVRSGGCDPATLRGRVVGAGQRTAHASLHQDVQPSWAEDAPMMSGASRGRIHALGVAAQSGPWPWPPRRFRTRLGTVGKADTSLAHNPYTGGAC